MNFKACKISSDNNNISIQTTDSSILSSDLKGIFDFIMQDNTTLLAWDMDEAISHILRKLSKNMLTQLHATGKCQYKGYKIFYITNKLFSVSLTKQIEFKSYNIYHLMQYFPDNEEPESIDKLQELINELLQGLKIMGFTPTKLSSAVAIYEEQVLSHISLPTITSSRITKQAAEYAYRCSGKLWIEAYQLGYFDNVFDYDISSAFPSIAKSLIDITDAEWIHSEDFIKDADYGYCKGYVTIYKDVNVSPIIYESSKGELSTPVGTWNTYLTKAEIEFIQDWNIGTFEIEDGWWCKCKNVNKLPLSNIANRLLKYKESSNKTVRLLAKRMCFSEDTNVWTMKGIRNVKDLEIGDFVYSVNPSTQNIELKPIESINIYNYQGNMFSISNHRHNFLITPEHLMFVKADNTKQYKFISIDSISQLKVNRWSFPKYKSIIDYYLPEISLWLELNENDTIIIIPNKKYSRIKSIDSSIKRMRIGGYHTTKSIINDPEEFENKYNCKLYIRNALHSGRNMNWKYDTNDLFELMGWYISEGHLQKKHNSLGITITTHKNNLSEIKQLLERMNLKCAYRIANNCTIVKIQSKLIHDYFLNNCNEYSWNKKIPKWTLMLDYSHLLHLYKTLMLGDGSTPKDRQMLKYTTVSKQLAEDFQHLCIRIGLKTSVNINQPSKRSKKIVYTIFIYNSRLTSVIKTSNIKQIPYNGKVYGITVKDNHTILAGRENNFEFIGQSVGGLYGKFGEEHKSSFGKHFNPVYFAEISSRCRLEVAEFIYKHKLEDSVIHISVDGVLSTKKVELE